MNKQRRIRQEKGITLIALIITIVVLLILAVVTINAIKGDGIIQYAKKARDDYQAKANEEQEVLSYLEAQMRGISDQWIQDKTTITKIGKNGTTTLKVGDTVNYVPTGSIYSGGWIVLGAKDGKILLMSEEYVSVPNPQGNFENPEAWKQLVNSSIDTSLSGGEYAQVNSARAITMEDINRLAGYTNKEEYGKGTVREYGNVVTYTITEKSGDSYTISYVVDGKPSITGEFFGQYVYLWSGEDDVGGTSTFDPFNHYEYILSQELRDLLEPDEGILVTPDMTFGADSDGAYTCYAGGIYNGTVGGKLISAINIGPSQIMMDTLLTAVVIELEKDVELKAGTTTDWEFGTEENTVSQGAWVQTGTTVKNSITNEELGVGDTVNYTISGYNGNWAVLGVEDGKILLVGTSTVTTQDVDEYGVEWFESIKNNSCKGLDQGKYGLSGSARILKLSDIDNITLYNKTKYNENKIDQYGNILNFTLADNGKDLTCVVEGNESLTENMEIIEGESGACFWKMDATSYISAGETYSVGPLTYYSYTISQLDGFKSGKIYNLFCSSSSYNKITLGDALYLAKSGCGYARGLFTLNLKRRNSRRRRFI